MIQTDHQGVGADQMIQPWASTMCFPLGCLLITVGGRPVSQMHMALVRDGASETC